MIREMVRRNCLIGLNYCKSFITDGGIGDSPDDLYRHIEHFFSLGAYENIALGSDFDGTTLPTYLNTPAKAADLYEYFLEKGMSRIWQRESCSGTQKNFSEKICNLHPSARKCASSAR